MEVNFQSELEAILVSSTARLGSNPDELVQNVMRRFFAEAVGFEEGVTRGEAALTRGDFLSHDQVGERLQRFL